jgi:leader peptidase (prepilin peptidase)/N-methyltransferase
MDIILPLSFLFFGLLIGSFLNVVIVRMEAEEGFLFGRSACRSCGSVIRWYDNIPILSFLILRGRCRECGASISWQYPVIEGVTAFLFLVVGLLFRPGDMNSVFETTLSVGLIPAMIIIFVYDLRHMEIPISAIFFSLLWALFSLGFLWLFSIPESSFLSSRLASGIIGGGIAFLLFYALVFFSKETWMGSGDAWIALTLGLVSGWEMLLYALSLSFGTGAVVGVVLLLLKKKEWGSHIPFGPFLSASVIFFLFFGTIIRTKFAPFLFL